MQQAMLRLRSEAIWNGFGFSYVEMLLVLWIVAVFIAFPMMLFKQTKNKIETEQFFNRFQSEVRYMQNYSILSQEGTVVKLRQTGEIRFTLYQTGKILQTMYLPEHLEVPQNKEIMFKGRSGNIADFPKLTFRSKDRKIFYHFIFQLGSGRYIMQIENKK